MASVSVNANVNPVANASGRGKGGSGSRADRDLLFGLLAVQLGVIDRRELLEALRIKSVGTPWGLPEILADLGLVDADGREVVDRMVEEHLQAQGAGPGEALLLPTGLAGGSLASPSASVGGQGDRLARIAAAWSIALLDPNISSGVPDAGAMAPSRPTLHRPPSSADPAAAAIAPYGFPRMESSVVEDGRRVELTCFERYEILREHAHGGLGVISVAFDHELQREVAIKEISAPLADDSHARARFLVEAEVTGSLEHPGIVPVHSLGFRDDGRPYYVMRLIQGESLREAIIRFHGLSRHIPPLPLRDRPLELRRLLARFVGVCNAVAFAHSKGVVHRDLKPDNIMLGAFGETLVIDWGLAKLTEGPPDEDDDDSVETPLPAEFKIEDSCTHPGAVIGTPGYMSPEQAEGAVDRVGPLSDIYSLGMTLRCLLTGRRPSDEERTNGNAYPRRKPKSPWPSRSGPGKKRGRWRSRSAPPPFRAPRSLQAIADKAAAERPEDRYQSAQALAEDLERWLADEPVAASFERWDERFLRWLRRHRSAARVAMVAGILLSLGVSAATVALDRSRRFAEDWLNKFETSIHQGRESLSGDLAALAADPRLQDQPELRNELLSRSLRTYQHLIVSSASEPDLVLGLARSQRQVAGLAMDLGDYGLAVEADRKAVATLERLAATQPGMDDVRRELARACEQKARDLDRLGQYGGAAEARARALEVRTQLAEADPDRLADRLDLARLQLDLARKYLDVRQVDASLPYLDQLRQNLEPLYRADPSSPALREAWGDLRHLEALDALHRRAPSAAIPPLQDARALLAPLPHRQPDLPPLDRTLDLARDRTFPDDPFAE